MSDRPIATVLAVVAAAMFLAAFSTAAVLRSDSTAVAEGVTPSSPSVAAATEEITLATIAAPSLSRVVALPALHLPARTPTGAKKKAATKVASAPRITTSTSPPPRHGDPEPAHLHATGTDRPAAAQVVGQRHLRHLRMIRGRVDGPQRPSLRWMAVGLAVALAAGLGGWAVADRIAADPVTPPSTQKVLDAGPARLKVSTGGRGRRARRRCRGSTTRPPTCPTRG